MSWLFRAALWVVPKAWRDSVQEDLVGEAWRAGRRGWLATLWCTWQALGLGLRLRSAVRGDLIMSGFKYAIRSLLRAPRFTIGAVLTFALGIGVNLAVFSAVDRLLFQKLPYAAPDELVQLHVCDSRSGRCSGAFPSVLVVDGRTKLTTLGPMAIAGFTVPFEILPATDDAPPLLLHDVSANLLRVLGVRPVLGRDMNEEDARSGNSVALLSFETWQRRFGGRVDVLERPLAFGPRRRATVIGVLPRGFVPPTEVAQDPNWDGLVLDTPSWAATSGRTGSVMAPFARLRPGASLEAARAEMASLAAALAPELRQPGTGSLPRIQIDRLESALYARLLKYAWLIVGASALILLMACANLSALLLVRGRSLQRTTAVRMALGAPPWRIVLTSMFETVVIATLGAGSALLALAASTRTMAALLPPMFGRYMQEAGSPRVLGLALLCAAVCAVTAGVWPGLAASRSDVQACLGGTGTRQSARVKGGWAMLVVESALGVVLVLGAALFVSSFMKMTIEPLGFTPEGLFRLRNVYSSARYPGVAGYEDVLQRLASVPGVTAVGGSDSVVGSGSTAMRGFSKDRAIPGERYETNAGYFRVLGTPLLAGREFTDDEVRGRAPVALLNMSGLSLVFPGVSPDAAIGRVVPLKDEAPRTIVGVVPDIRQRYGGLRMASIYVPLGTEPSRYGDILVRVTPDMSPGDLKHLVGQVLQADKALVAYVPDLMESDLRDPRFRAALLGILAIAGLVLTAAGLYALASFEVALRRQEIGVRMALGASARHIQTSMIRESAKPVLFGTAIGLVFAWWASAVFQSLLYRIDSQGPELYVVVAVTLLVTAVAAAWLPARRAARTDPAVVLRSP